MASITKHKNGRWRARYYDPAGKEHARHFERKADAEHWADSVRADIHSGTYVDPRRSRVTFGEWSDQWLAESVHLKPATVAGYESLLSRHVLPKWETVPLARIDRAAIKAWVSELDAVGLAAGTVKNVVNVTKAVFRSAVESGAIKVNPASGVRLPKAPSAEMAFLTAEEVETLADEVGGADGLLVRFAAYTGLRAGEVGALRWERVDLLRGTVSVVESFAEVHGKQVLGSTKTYANRTVGMPRFLTDQLGEHQAITGSSGYVFRSPGGGPIRHSNWYRRTFRPAVVRSGAPEGLRFHDLRHSAVALLVELGAHPLAIKERLGHSSITVTLDQYGHLFPSIDETLSERLDEVYRASVLRTPADNLRTAEVVPLKG